MDLDRSGWPVLTTGDFRETNLDSSETESESLTATLFNLDSLNESRPEVMQGTRWTNGQIPESPDSFVQPLVHRVNRGRLSRPHARSHNAERMQNDLSNLGLDGGLDANSVLDGPNDTLGPHQAFDVEPQTQSDPEVDTFGPNLHSPISTQSDPGPRPSIQGSQYLKKSLRKEFHRFSRNLRQRLLCGFFTKRDNGSDQRIDEELREENSSQAHTVAQPQVGSSSAHPNGLWEAAPDQLPQQP